MCVRAANVGDEDIFIKPRTRIWTVSRCEIESEDSKIEFQSVGNVEEIRIHEFQSEEVVVTSSEQEFEIPADVRISEAPLYIIWIAAWRRKS